MKKTIAIIMGGDSPERDISIITGILATKNLDKTEFLPLPILLKDNRFYYNEKFADIRSFQGEGIVGSEVVFSGNLLLVKSNFTSKFKPFKKVDCALLCTHGGAGEDGSLQGFFEVAGVPYTGSAVAQSATCMDKILTKKLLVDLGANVVEYATGTPQEIETKLGYPLIVKPAKLGSSIGISAAENFGELLDSINIATEFCEHILVEKKLENFTELNCAVAKIDGEVVASEIEKPIVWQDFLSFEDKYMDGNPSPKELPAIISQELKDEVQSQSIWLYQELNLSGVVRIDYLVDKTGKLLVNEINTIPGSLAHYLFEESGISFKKLLKKIIKEAILRKKESKKYNLNFTSDVLKNLKSMSKGKGKG